MDTNLKPRVGEKDIHVIITGIYIVTELKLDKTAAKCYFTCQFQQCPSFLGQYRAFEYKLFGPTSNIWIYMMSTQWLGICLAWAIGGCHLMLSLSLLHRFFQRIEIIKDVSDYSQLVNYYSQLFSLVNTSPMISEISKRNSAEERHFLQTPYLSKHDKFH